jgi:hypothetical protein
LLLAALTLTGCLTVVRGDLAGLNLFDTLALRSHNDSFFAFTFAASFARFPIISIASCKLTAVGKYI